MRRAQEKRETLLRGVVLSAALSVAALVASAGNDGVTSISGPSTMAARSTARYRVMVRGDAWGGACDVALSLRLPADFLLLDSSEAVTEDEAGAVRFSPRTRLAPGAEIAFEVELLASARGGPTAMCADLSYTACSGAKERFRAAPACVWMNVVASAAPAPVPESVGIPCIKRAATADGVISSGEYSGAGITTMTRVGVAAPNRVTIYSYHDTSTLYVAFAIDDNTNHGDRDLARLVIDSNFNGGKSPDTADRRYQIARNGQRQNWAGQGTNNDDAKWKSLSGSISSAARGEIAGGWVAEFAIPSADLGSFLPGATIGIGFIYEAKSDPDRYTTSPIALDEGDPPTWSDATLGLCGAVADFLAGPSCLGQAASFQDSSTPVATSWSWDFGDGSPLDTSQNPTHLFVGKGIYTVTLTACNVDGCSAMARDIEVFGLPMPDFVATPALVCSRATDPALASLDAALTLAEVGSVIPANGYQWATTLGSVGGSTLVTDTLAVTPGIFGQADVTLMVTDSRGCSSSIVKPVLFNRTPSPAIVATPARLCSSATPGVVDLNATGTTAGSAPIGATGYVFSASLLVTGSGALAQMQVPPGFVGNVNPCVAVTDGASCGDSACTPVDVLALPSPVLSMNLPRQCTDDVNPIVVQFDASTSTSPNGINDPGSFAWMTTGGTLLPGAGSRNTLTLPAGFAGPVSVDLAVTDRDTCGSTIRRSFGILAGPSPSVVVTAPAVCSDPSAPMFVDLDARGSVSAASIPDPGGYAWSASAGTLSNTNQSRTQLSVPPGFVGAVTIRCTVQDSDGCARDATQVLDIYAAPLPRIATPTVARCSDPVGPIAFALDGSGSLIGAGPVAPVWTWTSAPDVAIQGTGSMVNASVAPGVTGTRQVGLELVDGRGCRAATTIDLTLHALPTAGLVLDPMAQCGDADAAVTLQVDASSTVAGSGAIPANGFSFTASAGSFVGGPGPTRTLSLPPGFTGVVDVCVDVADALTCASRLCRQASVSAPPSARLVASRTVMCSDPTAAMVVDLDGSGSVGAIPDPGGYGWSTTVGSVVATSSRGARLTLAAGFVGVARVSLTTTTTDGCSDVDSVDVVVHGLPLPSLVATPIAACADPTSPTRFGLDAGGTTFPTGASASSFNFTVPTGHGSTASGVATVDWQVPALVTGSQFASVEVVDSNGCRAQNTVAVEVWRSPVAQFVASPTRLCSVENADFDIALDGSASVPGSGTVTPNSFRWTTDRGAILGAGANPVLRLPAGSTGQVQVCLELADANACGHRTCSVIEVDPLPIPDLVVQLPRVCRDDQAPLVVALDASGSRAGGAGGGLSFAWASSTGTVMPGNTAIATLLLPIGFSGPVDVDLTLNDGNGCGKVVRRSFVISPGPVPSIASGSSPCADRANPLLIPLDGSGSVPSTPGSLLAYAWTASTGTVTAPSLARPSLSLPVGFSGVVTVTLTVTDVDGCDRTTTEDIVVRDLPVVALVPSLSQICGSAAATLVQLDASGSSSTAGIDPSGFAWSTTVGVLSSVVGATSAVAVPPGYVGPIDVTVTVTDRAGCTWARTEPLEVVRSPEPAIVGDRNRACPVASGTDFMLDGSASTSYSGGLRYAWTTPVGVLSTSASPRTTLTLPSTAVGVTTVALEVTDSAGCRATSSYAVTLREPPVAVLDTSSVSVCADRGASGSLRLDGRRSAAAPNETVQSYSWIISGPASPASSSAPLVTVAFPPGTNGNFSATLVVTDGAGCVGSETVPFTVRDDPPPVVRLVASTTASCADPALPTTFAFDASGSSAVPPATLGAGGFSWTASAGSFVPTGNRGVLSFAAGSFGAATVWVRVRDSKGCEESADVRVDAVEPPSALAAVTPRRSCEATPSTGFALSDAGSRSHHPTDPSLAYQWSVTEGVVAQPNAATTALAVLNRDLSRPVLTTLVVSDALGCRSAPATASVQIDASPTVGFSAVVGLAGQVSNFVATGTSGTPPLVYTWSFGDGTSARGENVSHVYASRGSYSVTVAVSDAVGCGSVATRDVVVGEELSGSLVAGDGCAKGPIAFTATLQGGDLPYVYAWDFGDGTTATTSVPNTTHSFGSAGTHTVKVVVRDASGQSLTLAANTLVFGLPVVAIVSSGPSLVGQPQQLTATSSQPASFAWTFSDGGRAVGASVDHVFSAAGLAHAVVAAADGNACVGSATQDLFLQYPSATVSLAKVSLRGSVMAGDAVDYALYVSNGANVVTQVSIRDELPPGFTYQSGSFGITGATAAGLPTVGSSLVFPSFDLAAGTAVTIRYRAEVAATTATGDYRNRAMLRGVDGAGRIVLVGPAEAVVHVDRAAQVGEVDLVVTKRADPDPEPPVAGGLVRYRIEYENRGNVAATSVILRDDWPRAQADIAENGDAGMVLGSRIEWSVRRIAAGASGSVQYVLRLHDDLASGSAIRNVVTIEALEDDVHPGDNRASAEVVIGGSPDLVLTKAVVTDPDPADADALATYTLSWRNAGLGRAPAAVVVDDYDESRIEIVSPPAGAVDAGGILTIALGDLGPGDSGTLTYTAKLKSGAVGSVENQASLSSALADANPGDNAASARFDVVVRPAELSLVAEVSARRGCKRPQVEVAVRSELFDTAAAMFAASELLRTGERMRGLASDPLTGGLDGASALDRITAYAIANVRSLYLDSGMGLSYAATGNLGSAPITVPFATAHPVFRSQRALDEPWCQHETHAETNGAAIGAGFSAVAAFAAEAARRNDARLVQEAGQLLAEAEGAVSILSAWRTALSLRELPANIGLATDATGVRQPLVLDPRSHPGQIAALAHGLVRLIAAARAHPGIAPSSLEPSARELLTWTLSQPMVETVASDALIARDGVIESWAVAEVAELVAALGELGIAVPPGLDAAVRLSAERLDHVDGASSVVATSAAAAPVPSLDGVLDAARIALARGDIAAARVRLQSLEQPMWLESRLGIYRSAPQLADVSYSPRTIGALVSVLSRLVSSASGAERAVNFERLSRTVDRVLVEAGLQIGLVGRERSGGEDLRLILGNDGEVRIAAVALDGAHSMAPVMVDRVTFTTQGAHHRDLGLVDAARGVRAPASAVGYLVGARGDCRTARVELLDRKFKTESGLYALAGMDAAGRALESYGQRHDAMLVSELGKELRATAWSDRITLAMMSGMGIRIGQGAGVVGGEAELLDGYARAAGLERVPTGLLPVWLELGGGDPSFPEVVDTNSPYASGWDVSRFDWTVDLAAVGQALQSDVALVSAASERGDAWSHFVARVRLHAAALKVAHLDRELARGQEVGSFTPVLDAAGRPVAITSSPRAGDVRGLAAVLRGVAAYRTLVTSDAVPALLVPGDGPPVAASEAARLTTSLLDRLLKKSFREVKDPVALAYAVEALLDAAAIETSRASSARAAAGQAAQALADLEPSASISPLAQAAMALRATALTGASVETVAAAFADLRERFFDDSWRIFRPTAGAESEVVLADLDAGATLAALAAALPRLRQSQAEEASELIYGAGVRMLVETGLQRDHRREARAVDGNVVARAPQLSSRVRLSIVESAGGHSSLFPGDIIAASFTVANAAEGSVASDVLVHVAQGAALDYVPGSTRIAGKPASDPAGGENLSFALGRLGGGQSLAVNYLLRVKPSAAAGTVRVATRSEARSAPGAAGEPIATPAVAAGVTIERFGVIEGVVFVDLDGDGVRGANEIGAAEVTISLDDGTATVTDDEGRFSLTDLQPAGYALRLGEASLPSAFRATGTVESQVAVRPGVVTTASFALKTTGIMTGIVFRDDNGNHRRDAGEETVAGVVVESDGGFRSISDATGRYVIRGVEIGSHQIRVARRQPYVKDANDLSIRPMPLPESDAPGLGARASR